MGTTYITKRLIIIINFILLFEFVSFSQTIGFGMDLFGSTESRFQNAFGANFNYQLSITDQLSIVSDVGFVYNKRRFDQVDMHVNYNPDIQTIESINSKITKLNVDFQLICSLLNSDLSIQLYLGPVIGLDYLYGNDNKTIIESVYISDNYTYEEDLSAFGFHIGLIGKMNLIQLFSDKLSLYFAYCPQLVITDFSLSNNAYGGVYGLFQIQIGLYYKLGKNEN